MGTKRYLVTGWNQRFCHWDTDTIEAKSARVAKEMYKQVKPNLTKVRPLLLLLKNEVNHGI